MRDDGFAIISIWENQRAKGGLPSMIGGAYPPDERKEGDANVYYILGSDPVLYIHCCPCESDLSDFQGKKIAATTHNSDG